MKSTADTIKTDEEHKVTGDRKDDTKCLLIFLDIPVRLEADVIIASDFAEIMLKFL